MRLLQSLCLVPWLLSHSYAANNLPRTTTTDANGNIVFMATAVEVYNSLPTLIHNCDNLPAICANFARYKSLNSITNGPYYFHYDENEDRKKKRRNSSCPKSWQKYLPGGAKCGSVPGQPNVMPFNLPPVVGVAGGPWTPIFGDEIANAANDGPSGMKYTCDELPAAS